jgi:hypothetical protein
MESPPWPWAEDLGQASRAPPPTLLGRDMCQGPTMLPLLRFGTRRFTILSNSTRQRANTALDHCGPCAITACRDGIGSHIVSRKLSDIDARRPVAALRPPSIQAPQLQDLP